MASQRQVRAAAGVGRILAKLNQNIDSGNFYEAHQLYRTLYFRYCSILCSHHSSNYVIFTFRYSGQSKFAEAEDLLFNGALELFSHNQVSSGVDLTKLFIEVLEKTNQHQRPEDELEKAFQRVVGYSI